MMRTNFCRIFRLSALLSMPTIIPVGAESVARIWNEQNLAAIRLDFPNPPVHARNLFHVSVAMWDAWAAYDSQAVGYIHNEWARAEDPALAREEAISYAAYRILRRRYGGSVNGGMTLKALKQQMEALGYDADVNGIEGDAPAAVGNRVAAAISAFCENDGSRELFAYRDPTYTPQNPPLVLLFAGTTMTDPNRWQPLAFETASTQNGQVADRIQTYVGSHWGGVRPFALASEGDEPTYLDPGPPPQLGGASDAAFKGGNLAVIRSSSVLDPEVETMIDISPGAYGNHPLGRHEGRGHEKNPVTGGPYASNVVKLGDFARVLAEFWADGPHSETPPGHWNVLANEIAEHPEFERRFQGGGDPLDPLEWDVKLYFALNGAMHDAAVAAWGCKRNYDFVRPISSIRYMGGLGQSSDPAGPSYHPLGLPLVAGLIEVITAESSAPGERHAHLSGNLGGIALVAWKGEPDNPLAEHSGVGWIMAESWLPYQRDTFVTPAFAGYVSGHSTFSRAAAEVLTRFTGSPFFPGGLGSFTAPRNAFLAFERGPSTDVVLQWGTYYDAADQAGISRIYGGIHVPADDGPGRVMGASCGSTAVERASKYFDGSILEEAFPVAGEMQADGDLALRWRATPGFYYRVESSVDLEHFLPETPSLRAETFQGGAVILGVRDREPNLYFRVMRTLEPAP